MNINEVKNDIIFKFWETLERKNISNITTNKFIKKPYLENYIIQLSPITNNDKLVLKIINLLDSNKITNEELFLFLSNSTDFDQDNKKSIENYILNSEDDINKLAIEIIVYEVKYFRFYQMISELLFEYDNKQENELYNFILIYIKNNRGENKKYSKKNIKFNIFQYFMNDLFETYNNIFNILKKNSVINSEFNKSVILNLFLKNIFTNWYNIYKNDILANTVNEKIKDHVLPRSLISRILCLPNI
jgi:hypothetical protein